MGIEPSQQTFQNYPSDEAVSEDAQHSDPNGRVPILTSQIIFQENTIETPLVSKYEDKVKARISNFTKRPPKPEVPRKNMSTVTLLDQGTRCCFLMFFF